MATPDGSPLSAEMWEELRGLGDDFVSEFIEAYLKDAGVQVSEYPGLLERRDSESLFKAAHKMKGGSGQVGALHLSELCNRLQEAARESRWEECAELVPEIEAEHVRVVEALKVEMGR